MTITSKKTCRCCGVLMELRSNAENSRLKKDIVTYYQFSYARTFLGHVCLATTTFFFAHHSPSLLLHLPSRRQHITSLKMKYMVALDGSDNGNRAYQMAERLMKENDIVSTSILHLLSSHSDTTTALVLLYYIILS